MLTVFALLMGGKLALLLMQPLPDAWHGDSGDYVGKALYFHEHGVFPPIRSDAPGRSALTYSDFRPPGYPLFIAALLDFGKTVPEITYNVRLAQFVLDLVTTAILLWVVWRFHPSTRYRWLAVLVLGVQPWTSAFIVTLNPDTLTAFLMVTGLGLLALFVTARTATEDWPWVKALALVPASLLLSLTFLIRPEMIVFAFAMILIGLAMTLPALPRRTVARYGVLAAIPFLAMVAANMAYRWQVAEEVRIYGAFKHATPGLMQWTKTWIGPQAAKEGVVFGPLMIGLDGFGQLPVGAFTDEAERESLLAVVRVVEARGAMTPEEDRLFGAIAQRRIAADPWGYYLWNRLYGACYFWINLSNAAHYLNGFSLLPQPLSKLLTGGFLVLKLLILAFFVLGIVLFPWRDRSTLWVQWHLSFLLLGIAFVLMRTFYFAGVAGYVEYRYALVAWPFVLAVALYGLARIFAAWRR